VDIEGLLGVPLLRVLPRSRVAELARDMPVRIVPVGQVVARDGDPATHLLIVESGSLAAVHETPAGTRVRLAAVTGPCTLDKAATLHEAVHTATWAATTACRIRLLRAQVLRQLLHQEPALREHVLRYLATEVNTHRRSRIRRAASDPVAQVADWLVEKERAIGSSIPLSGGQQGLGEELGLSRVTVNRALSTLSGSRCHPGAPPPHRCAELGLPHHRAHQRPRHSLIFAVAHDESWPVRPSDSRTPPGTVASGEGWPVRAWRRQPVH